MVAWVKLELVAFLILAALVAMPFGEAMAQEEDAETSRVTVELQEFDGSGISGTATLTAAAEESTRVSMELRGGELDGNHPTHIHTGTCDDFDPDPLYPLETVELSPVDRLGMSETTVEDVSLKSLIEGDFVILVHQSPEELTTYLVCGDIGLGAVEATGESEQRSSTERESQTPGATTEEDHEGAAGHTGRSDKVDTMAKTGSGPTAVTDGLFGSQLPVMLGLLAIVAAGVAFALRRSRT